MSQRFRIGIVGCGKIAPRHLTACLLSDQVEVTTLIDPVVERARDLARRFDIGATVASIISDTTHLVDGFVIAAPNDLHHKLAMECLQHGVPVLIEKPLATSVQDGEAICRASEEKGIVAAVGYMTRFRENVQLFHSLLQSNYFGAVRRFAYQFGARGGWTPLSSYTLDRRVMGGGVMVTTGSHFLDRMIYWFGYPEAAWMEDDSLGGPEANALATLRYHRHGKQFQGVVSISRTVNRTAGFVMETDQGIATVGDNPDSRICFHPYGDTKIELTVGRRNTALTSNGDQVTDCFQLQLEDFARACISGKAPMVPARDGLASLRLIEQLYSNRRPMPSEWYPSLRGRSTK